MQLQFVGSGDAFGTGGRFNTCFLVRHNGGAFLIDCGATSLVALRKADVDPAEIDSIFITHLHGDHFGGLPFFLLEAEFASLRTRPLRIIGPFGLEERLVQLMEALYLGAAPQTWRFPLEIIEIGPNDSWAADGVSLRAYPMFHPCGAPPLGLRFEVDGRSLAFTGDTAWTPAIVELGRGADLLIIECSNFEAPQGHHLAYREIEANAAAIGARRIVLSHFGPETFARRHEIMFEQASDGLMLDI